MATTQNTKTTDINGNGNLRVGIKSLQPRITTKIFSATMQKGRDMLDTLVNDWLAANYDRVEVKEIRALLSSDNEFHCLTIVIIAHELAREEL